MFSFDPSQLIPDQWPVFDELAIFSPFSSSSSLTSPSPSVQSDPLPPAFPSPASLAAMPIPPSRSSPRNKNPNHIPRPRNAFMLFRSAFAAAQKISTTIEHDNRHITRIIAHCWNRLSDSEKQIWRDKAAAEKAQHAERYPDYRFRPIGRAKKPKKRKVRRNGVEDVERCETLANLVMAGKYGRELEHALNKIQVERASAEWPLDAELDVFSAGETRGTLLGFDPLAQDPETEAVPPFRSPLLPPAGANVQLMPEQNLMPQPLAITTAPQVDPQTFKFCSLTHSDAVSPLDDLQSLLYQYQPDICNDVSSQGSIPPTQYQTALTLVQDTQGSRAEIQPVRDFSLLPWNPSQLDEYSYYHH